MDAKQAAEVLERHNKWHRGDDSVSETDPKELGLAIETVVAAIKAQRELCRHVHDRILRGDSDSRLLTMLSVGYGPGPYIIPGDEEPQPVAALKAQSKAKPVWFAVSSDNLRLIKNERIASYLAAGLNVPCTPLYASPQPATVSAEAIAELKELATFLEKWHVSGIAKPIRRVLAELSNTATQPASAAVPDDWQLVPIQPTPEMLTAWNEARTREAWGQDSRPDYAAPYRAMLAAAPAAGGGE